jgi:MFS family permease
MSAVAIDISMMIVGRVVQGIGGSALPLAFGIIRDEVPRDRMPAVIGLASALSAVGGGVGIVLSGPFTAALGVRGLFWIPMGSPQSRRCSRASSYLPRPSRNGRAISFQHDQVWQVVVATGLLSISVGSAVATMTNVIVAAVRPDRTGIANGVNANVRTIDGAVGAALLGGYGQRPPQGHGTAHRGRLRLRLRHAEPCCPASVFATLRTPGQSEPQSPLP